MVFVECNPDKYVIERISYTLPKNLIRHGGGKGNVIGLVNKTVKSIGIIDQDPYGDQFQYKDINEKYSLIETEGRSSLLMRNNDNTRKLIQISPDIEGWFVYKAEQNRISLGKYGLPNDRKKMHDIRNLQRKMGFQQFIDELLKINDNEINAIRKWINEM